MYRHFIPAALACVLATNANAGPIADKAAEVERLLEEGKVEEAVNTLDMVVNETWATLPLVVRNVQYVTAIEGYGVYALRDGHVYKAGDKVFLYAEVLGYEILQDSIGNKQVAFDLGIRLKNKAGKTLVNIDKGISITQPIRGYSKEFVLKIDLNFKGAPVGEYVAELTATDRASRKSAIFEVPFTVAE